MKSQREPVAVVVDPTVVALFVVGPVDATSLRFRMRRA